MAKAAIDAGNLQLKRAYEAAAASDGTRILVERLWPRGVRKEDAHLDDWMKAVAPSTELRKWFDHEVPKWPEFQRRYRAELQEHAAELGQLRAIAARGRLTLVYGARDETHNAAVVLRGVLLDGEA